MIKQKNFKKTLKSVFVILSVVLILLTVLSKNESLRSKITGKGTPDIQANVKKTVEAYASKNGFEYNDYPNDLLELLERNPETEDFVLSYPIENNLEHEIDLSEFKGSDTVPLFLQWDKRWGYIEYGSSVAGLTACGPVCLSMCAYYLTENEAFSPDHMIDFALDNGYCARGKGSQWSLISEGGEQLGLNVEEFPLVEKKIKDCLKDGNPIICVMGPGHFTTTGHFIVLADYDSKNDIYKINDPNSKENSCKKWRYDDFSNQIKNLWVISA